MARKDRFANPYANMHNAGGNHQAQTIPGILQEGRKSYKQTMDSKLGTNHSPNPAARTVRHINPPKQVQSKPITPKR